MNKKAIKKIILEDKINETYNTVTLRFENSGQNKINYLPGQFIRINTRQFKELDGILRGRKQGPRAYSIGSSPTKEYIDITIKKEQEGLLSTWIVDEAPLKIGDEVEVDGPFGKFIFEDAYKEDVVLIGAGSGIVPLKSIMQYIIDKKMTNKVILLNSNKTVSDIIYKKELEEFSENNNIKIYNTITREQVEKYKTGRINEEIVKETIEKLTEKRYYICGPAEFTKNMKDILIKNNVDGKIIKKESW